MSVNVVERLLRNMFLHIGASPADFPDRWANGKAFTELKCTKRGETDPKRIILEAKETSSFNAARVWLLDSGASFH